jgi:hypothetical protein
MAFGIFLAVVFGIGVLVYLGQRASARVRFITTYVFPSVLARKVREKYPHLTDVQMGLVARGLRQYFLICYKANKQFVSMPSQAADELWHEFILHTRSYQQFCNKAFGRFIHHLPAEAMISKSHAQDGIKRTWRLACAAENINPQSPSRLPFIFALDGLLQIPDGFEYSLDCKNETGAGAGSYCAGDIGCSSGCGGSSGSDAGDSGCGGGCGGD